MNNKRVMALLWVGLVAIGSAYANVTPTGKNFWHFESGQVRPLAMSPDGNQLFAVNTPDNHLEIFNVTAQGLVPAGSVPVGLEPVAVAARSNGEVWVVNHMSDSISIVDVSVSPARVVRTLLVGDEPRDIVFAGQPAQPEDPFPRAFITTAHRGQANPDDIFGDKYGDFFTPSVGRADVWVFDANNLGASVGGTAETVLTFFGDTPRALAASPSGDKVYAAVFHSGNKTTILPESGNVTTVNSGVAPTIPTIVKFNGADWVDDSGSVQSGIRLQLPDFDVFEIDAVAATPSEIRSFSGVGTILFNMAVNPVSGKVYVSNTEANNLVQFEPVITSNIHRARISVIDGLGTVVPRQLNKHINYSVVPSPAGTSDDSLATPVDMQISSDGSTLYVAAFGSSKVGVFNIAALENDTFVPDDSTHIDVTGGGPTGIVLDEARSRIYVLTRFDNGVSVIDSATQTELDHLLLHNPEPASVTDGRPFMYDANLSSSNGEASCSSCHVFSRMDDLAWDLGDPGGSIIANPNPFLFAFGSPLFHPEKGPMMTQSFRGMDNHGPMHWRGDRSGALVGGSFDDEDAAFKQFNPAFVGLLGRSAQLSVAELQAFTDFSLQINYPPNPIRNLDNSLTAEETSGEALYFLAGTDTLDSCNGCHVLDASLGLFGTSGQSTFEAAPQDMKVAHMRNMYQKVGMFGGVPTTISVPFVGDLSTPSHGPADQPQVRGFGYTHNGTVDTLMSFTGISLFNYPGNRAQAISDISQFLLAFPAELAPVVGQQITLDAGNGAAVGSRIDLFIQRAQVAAPNPVSAQQKECDLVVQGNIDGSQRSWLFNTSSGNFDPDYSVDVPLSDVGLRALVAGGGQLTYTCAPPGSGPRMALDRDQDGLLNFDEVATHGSNPASTDSDGDSLSDFDEVTIHGTEPGLADSDSDGLDDAIELFTTGTDPNDSDSDDDGTNDGDEVSNGTDPNDAAPTVSLSSPADGDIFFSTDSIDLMAAANDNEDGDLSAVIQWSSSIDGNVGVGASVPVGLSEGVHTISASVVDSASAQAVAQVVITVDGIPGDIDGDGVVTVADLLLMQKHILGSELIVDTLMLHRADIYPVQGDDVLTVADLLYLQNLLAILP